ncbi:MAG: hypothetical protein ABID45_03740 [Patescibacteria group bacterium]
MVRPFLIIFLTLFLLIPAITQAKTFVVDDLGEASDASAGDGDCVTAAPAVCTIRAAIEESNAYGGSNVINFSVAGTIDITSALEITNGGLIINGGSNHDVVINGNAKAHHGFYINNVANNIIKGLVIQDFNYGIYIRAASATGNKVFNCYIGTNAAGDAAVANDYGVLIGAGASSNFIGTDGDGSNDATEGNIISGNALNGIHITASNSNTVAGNYMGVNAAGTDALTNVDAVRILGAAQSNIIGTNADGTSDTLERNIISGNTDGFYISAAGTNSNHIAGNYIGLNAAGDAAVPNVYGIKFVNGPQSNIIGTNGDGTNDAVERNIISGNTSGGVYIYGTSSDSNWVAGNYIGLNPAGTAAIANKHGIHIQTSPQSNIIGTNGDGTADADERNIISGNTNYGIIFSVANSNNVAGNYIGLNAAGDAAVANVQGGVYLYNGSSSNIIGTNGDGTADAVERNIISGNTSFGVYISDASSSLNKVAGNYIGTGTDGTSDFGNAWHGIRIDDTATSNTIGGDTVTLQANIIAFNGDAASEYGVSIEDSGTDYNNILRNSIFSNEYEGIKLLNGSNEGIATPAITGAVDGGGVAKITLSGTCPVDASGVDIELFKSDDNGEGKTYIKNTSSTDGNWSTIISGAITVVGEKIVATATDSSDNTSEFSSELTVADIDAVADTTGSDTSVNEGATANLVGTTSYDPNSGQSVSSYLWEWIGGEEVTIIDPTLASASFVAPEVLGGGGETTIRLTVNGNEGTDTVVVDINNINAAPTVDSVYVSDTSLEKNDDFGSGIDLVGGSGKNIYINGTVGDVDGADYIDTVEVVFYRSGATGGVACSADNNDCYKIATCGLAANDATHKDYDCLINLKYWADATAAGGPYPDEDWKVYVKVTDVGALTDDDATHADIEMNSTLALTIPVSIIYGTHALSFSNTAADNQEKTIVQQGNTQADVEVSGTALTCTIGTMPAGNQEWSITDVDHGLGTDLTGSAVDTNLDIGYRTDDVTPLTKLLYWSIEVPATGVGGSCTGTNTVTAIVH